MDEYNYYELLPTVLFHLDNIGAESVKLKLFAQGCR